MRKIISLLFVLIFLTGCSIQYHGYKKFTGKGKNIKTKLGDIKGADFIYEGTLDVILGSIIKKQPIPPANLGFMNPEE